MPVIRVSNGYKCGRSGKVYKQKTRAARQCRAIHASGYKGKSSSKLRSRGRRYT